MQFSMAAVTTNSVLRREDIETEVDGTQTVTTAEAMFERAIESTQLKNSMDTHFHNLEMITQC